MDFPRPWPFPPPKQTLLPKLRFHLGAAFANPRATKLLEKLQFLQKNQLNLYSGIPDN
jgi:hypothetical protein